jgi:LCP family protein required for cell wall assembly
MRRRLTLTLFLILLTACEAFPAQVQTLAATPTALILVTVPPDATPTPTPFQPLLDTEASTPTSIPPTPSEQPTSPADTPSPVVISPTPDPAALLPGDWSPPAISAPNYAPAPFPILTDNETVTFALLGSDSRGGQSFRTDTMVIAALRPKSGQVTLISIPRDLWVYIPSNGMQRINTAYEFGEIYHYPGGGPALFKDTLLYNLGIRIDHIAMVNFDGFRQIVDTLGGIDVPIACAYTDWHLIDPSYDPYNENNWSLYTVGPGMVHMDGDLSLWYARSRKKSSDFDRGRRQQEVLRAIYSHALQVDAIAKIPQLYNDLNSAVTTDLGLPALLQLSPLAFHLTNADIRSYYIGKSLVTGWMTPGGASVLLPNGPAIQAMLQEALSPSSRPPEMENILIEVRNGTYNSGWDTLAAQRLNYAGYEARTAPADRTDYAGSLLYDLTPTQDPNRAVSLLAILGLPLSALVSAPMQSEVSYVLLVGADYQPCFNPDNMAP